MQEDIIDAYFVCIKKKRLVESVARKVFLHFIPLTLSIQGYNKQCEKRVTLLSASFFILILLNLCLLLVLRLSLVKYCFFNSLEESINKTLINLLLSNSPKPPKIGDVVVRTHGGLIVVMCLTGF